VVTETWAALQETQRRFLAETSIADLASRHRERRLELVYAI
jgi:hypothetical protein